MVDPQKVDTLPGLGPKSAEWLCRVGITTVKELREAGAVVAYLRVEQAGLRPGLNLLWALHGALEGKGWAEVTADEKAKLRAELTAIRGS